MGVEPTRAEAHWILNAWAREHKCFHTYSPNRLNTRKTKDLRRSARKSVPWSKDTLRHKGRENGGNDSAAGGYFAPPLARFRTSRILNSGRAVRWIRGGPKPRFASEGRRRTAPGRTSWLRAFLTSTRLACSATWQGGQTPCRKAVQEHPQPGQVGFSKRFSRRMRYLIFSVFGLCIAVARAAGEVLLNTSDSIFDCLLDHLSSVGIEITTSPSIETEMVPPTP